MKEFIKAVKDNINSLIFWSLFGLSLGYNVQHYNQKEYIKDLQELYWVEAEGNHKMIVAFDSAVKELKHTDASVTKEFKRVGYDALYYEDTVFKYRHDFKNKYEK